MNVTYSGYQIPGSPFQVNVAAVETPQQQSRQVITVTGTGMSSSSVGQRTEFVIDGFARGV